MIAQRFWLGVFTSSVLGCGERSGLDVDPQPSSSAFPISDASAPSEVSTTDAARGPCHLTLTGKPVTTVQFDTFSFHQNGILLRESLTDQRHVIQYGSVDGIRTGVWQDPPIFAAEYDVSVWPPKVVRAPTQLFDSVHDPADLIELPNNKLGLTWWWDNDGAGPQGTRYRTLDATSWQLDPDVFLIPSASTFSRPNVMADRSGFVSVFSRYIFNGGTAPDARDGNVGFFDLAGGTSAPPVSLWTNTGNSIVRAATFVRTRTQSLVVLTFGDCDSQTDGAFCESRSIVILRILPTAPPNSHYLVKVASVSVRDATKVPIQTAMVSDRNGTTWLTWWEQERLADGGTPNDILYLYAEPMDDSGNAIGPVENWSVGNQFAYDPSRSFSVGPLGAIYFTSVTPNVSERDVHILHRQLDTSAPIEDITFSTANTSFPLSFAQIAEPRTLIVGFSNYPRARDPVLE